MTLKPDDGAVANVAGGGRVDDDAEADRPNASRHLLRILLAVLLSSLCVLLTYPSQTSIHPDSKWTRTCFLKSLIDLTMRVSWPSE
jgi:hypothetical protein